MKYKQITIDLAQAIVDNHVEFRRTHYDDTKDEFFSVYACIHCTGFVQDIYFNGRKSIEHKKDCPVLFAEKVLNNEEVKDET